MRTHAIHKQAPLMRMIQEPAKPGHTPGPWIFTGNAGQVFAFNSRKVADCGNAGMNKENASNARLIAGAPIMLEALQAVADSMEGSDTLLAQQVRDAIRKATE